MRPLSEDVVEHPPCRKGDQDRESKTQAPSVGHVRDARAERCGEVGGWRNQKKTEQIDLAERIGRYAMRGPSGERRADGAGNGDDEAEGGRRSHGTVDRIT